ncbi:hypothetical protein SAMN05660686_03001 [Thalassobaculum litoreum DSM 18839]|uniref:Nucleoside 2-deoxyribosyltransferase n=2 Tax=Thalassobaculum TaxID=526215 RepID=A0A8G2BJ33_9PROT|nr:hypothetical protein SAMN05660686_03001 [Thalassobaculum litoreum DSM 18839]
MANEFEFNRNHWAVKDVDLFRELFRFAPPRRQLPKVFTIRDHPLIEDDLVSVMMPFDAGFTPVFKAIRDAVDEADLRCLRVDDLWEADAIIDDVVSLIDRSRVVICDCTGRNANVFYEAGIAHTLGRPVVLLTQRSEDIPFDLRHIRYIEYLKNEEGLKDMAAALSDRLKTIKDREV